MESSSSRKIKVERNLFIGNKTKERKRNRISIESIVEIHSEI
jgi:hypothetical protein